MYIYMYISRCMYVCMYRYMYIYIPARFGARQGPMVFLVGWAFFYERGTPVESSCWNLLQWIRFAPERLGGPFPQVTGAPYVVGGGQHIQNVQGAVLALVVRQ